MHTHKKIRCAYPSIRWDLTSGIEMLWPIFQLQWHFRDDNGNSFSFESSGQMKKVKRKLRAEIEREKERKMEGKSEDKREQKRIFIVFYFHFICWTRNRYSYNIICNAYTTHTHHRMRFHLYRSCLDSFVSSCCSCPYITQTRLFTLFT